MTATIFSIREPIVTLADGTKAQQVSMFDLLFAQPDQSEQRVVGDSSAPAQLDPEQPVTNQEPIPQRPSGKMAKEPDGREYLVQIPTDISPDDPDPERWNWWSHAFYLHQVFVGREWPKQEESNKLLIHYRDNGIPAYVYIRDMMLNFYKADWHLFGEIPAASVKKSSTNSKVKEVPAGIPTADPPSQLGIRIELPYSTGHVYDVRLPKDLLCWGEYDRSAISYDEAEAIRNNWVRWMTIVAAFLDYIAREEISFRGIEKLMRDHRDSQEPIPVYISDNYARHFTNCELLLYPNDKTLAKMKGAAI